MTDTFCPIYKEASEAQPWEKTTGQNAGLLFDKFAEAWTWKQDQRHEVMTKPRIPLFDVGNQKKRERDKNETEKQGYWTKKLPNRIKANSDLLNEACQRQQDLVYALGGQLLCLKNTSRFITGMGRQHPLENGFTFHHILGVPYLPGSSLKGVLRAWLRETHGQWDDVKDRWKESQHTKDRFGTQDAAGRFILLDMLPTAPPRLTVDVMTPHYGPYYQNGETPGDWHNPRPIQFLTVEENSHWQLGILPAQGQRQLDGETITAIKLALIEALEMIGAGAKTAVGYGCFDQDSAAENIIDRESAQRRRKREESRKYREELAQLPPEQAELYRRIETESWRRDKSAFLSGIERYLDESTNLGKDIIRVLLELIEQWDPGIWENPDRTRGKKKNFAYKERPRKIVHRLKQSIVKGAP